MQCFAAVCVEPKRAMLPGLRQLWQGLYERNGLSLTLVLGFSTIASSTIATSTVAPEELPKTISGVLSVFFNHSFVRYLAHGIVCV